MVVYKGCIKNVLSRIYLEGVAYYGEPPQIYWEAKQALERLDNTCLTVNSNSDPNSPLGWRRNNYPILVVGKKNNKLKFSYTKKQLNNGDILIIVEEVADAYGHILTENKLKYVNNTMKTNKKTIRLTESDLRTFIEEAVKDVLKEKKINRDYRDNDGNKISGKKALVQGGEYLKSNGSSFLNAYANQAVYNQAEHLYTVLDNFLKTIQSNSEMWRYNDFIKLAKNFKSELKDKLYAKYSSSWGDPSRDDVDYYVY